MKWFEIIELRSIKSEHVFDNLNIRSLITDVIHVSGSENVRICRNAVLDTALSIHLIHTSENVDPDGSSLGIRLSTALKEFGLVNHGIWIENNKIY